MKIPAWLKVYGDINFRGFCATESQEQITFFHILKIKHFELFSCAVHVRNEGKRSYAQAHWQKREGMNPGAADIIIPGSPTFVCELKRKDHTKCKWQKGQIEYLESAKNRGAFVCISLGHLGAMIAINEYIKKPH